MEKIIIDIKNELKKVSKCRRGGIKNGSKNTNELDMLLDKLISNYSFTEDIFKEKILSIKKEISFICKCSTDTYRYSCPAFREVYYENLILILDLMSNNSIVEKYKLKKSKVFISHSSKDKDKVLAFVEILERIGLNKKDMIFCTSVSGYGIEFGEDIYDRIKKEYENYDLYVIFMLSENYYKSAACLNEMGATWILRNKYQTILLPGFEYSAIQGAINPMQMAFKLDDYDTRVANFLKLKRELENIFGLKKIEDEMYRRYETSFFESIDK